MPDVQFFGAENRAAQVTDLGLTRGHPDLAIEVVSRTSVRYDRKTKLAWYASIGVPEYWIVEPERRLLERFVLQGDLYLVAEVAGEDAVFRPDSFEGLEIPLSELWAIPGR